MRGYWLTFADRSQAYCEGKTESDARAIARKLTGKDVTGAKILPYPANPIVWQFTYENGGKCPAFCYRPNECAGNTSCRRRPACSE